MNIRDCCNSGYGCGQCFCESCWGKILPECSKIKDKPHIKNNMCCTHCFKDVKEICLDHYMHALYNIRELKYERNKEEGYYDKYIAQAIKKWEDKYKR